MGELKARNSEVGEMVDMTRLVRQFVECITFLGGFGERGMQHFPTSVLGIVVDFTLREFRSRLYSANTAVAMRSSLPPRSFSLPRTKARSPALSGRYE